MSQQLMEKIQEISNILDTLPLNRSEFEFKNFVVDSYPTTSRLVANLLMEMETALIKKLEIEQNLSANPSLADKLRYHRQLKLLDHQINQLSNWWSQLPKSHKNINPEDYEKQESQYWIKTLAKQAALELLTTDRTSTATMTKLSNLSQKDFLESVRLCIEFLTMFKNTTAIAENAAKTK